MKINKFLLINLIIKKININVFEINKLFRIKKKFNLLKLFFNINFNFYFLYNQYPNYNYKLKNNYLIKTNFLKIPNIQNDINISNIINSNKTYLYDNLTNKITRIIKNIIFLEMNKMKFIEIGIPLIINYSNLLYSKHIPKFYNDLFKLNGNEFLIPTSETILNCISIFIKNFNNPIKFICDSNCFRKEYGNINRKNSGFKKLNQFEKIEIFSYFLKNETFERFYEICSIVIYICKIFNLKYRIIKINTNDLNKNAFYSFDIEIWSSLDKDWIELSSLSICLNNSHTKYLNKKKIFSINASCLPINRLIYLIFIKNRISNLFIKLPEKISIMLTELLKW